MICQRTYFRVCKYFTRSSPEKVHTRCNFNKKENNELPYLFGVDNFKVAQKAYVVNTPSYMSGMPRYV